MPRRSKRVGRMKMCQNATYTGICYERLLLRIMLKRDIRE